MWIYLLKVTLIWGLLLLCFELLYKKSAYYKVNRIYLVLTLVSGLILPLLPFTLPEAGMQGNNVNAIAQWNNQLQQLEVQAEIPKPAAALSSFSYTVLFAWLYGSGLIVMFGLSIYDIIVILRKAIYGNYEVYAGHKIFKTGKAHAPFSFFGWIFISKPELYSEAELRFILKHEDSHNKNRHWLDILIMQCFIIVFWFHPMVWRIRHLLKLEHEYEADQCAAGSDAYSYGHFLLQQTLMRAPHPIAHSFHYSPIKLRINMLTQSGKRNPWKYLALVPALLGCTLLMAKTGNGDQKNRVGDRTIYRGNTFDWKAAPTDSITLKNTETGEVRTIRNIALPQIIEMNGEKVYHEDSLKNSLSSIVAQFRNKGQSIHEYLKEKLMEQTGPIPDSLSRIDLTNMVVDEKGRIVYYDLVCSYSPAVPAESPFAGHNVNNDPKYSGIMDKIIKESPDWLPAMVNGIAVPVFFQDGGALIFKEQRRAFRAVKLEQVQK